MTSAKEDARGQWRCATMLQCSIKVRAANTAPPCVCNVNQPIQLHGDLQYSVGALIYIHIKAPNVKGPKHRCKHTTAKRPDLGPWVAWAFHSGGDCPPPTQSTLSSMYVIKSA